MKKKMFLSLLTLMLSTGFMFAHGTFTNDIKYDNRDTRHDRIDIARDRIAKIHDLNHGYYVAARREQRDINRDRKDVYRGRCDRYRVARYERRCN